MKRITDNDRLAAAFAELRARRIVAVAGAGYTLDEGWEDGAELRRDDDRGAVFYHGQDEERAREGEGLLLAFAAFAGGDEATRDLGREVAEVLRRHGLAALWDDRVDTRLRVSPFDWQEQPPGRGRRDDRRGAPGGRRRGRAALTSS